MIKTKKRLFLHLCLFLFIPTIAFSQSSQESAIRQQDRFMRDQQQRIEKLNRQKEFDAIKKERERQKEAQLDKVKDAQRKRQDDPNCAQLKKIEISGWQAMSDSKQKKLFRDLIGKCIDGTVFSKAIDILNQYHHARGYVTTQVSVPKQNINTGIIRLDVIKGRVQKIIIEESLDEALKEKLEDDSVERMQETKDDPNSFLHKLALKTQKLTAFGNIEGEVLNIKDIDQGVYQINRLASNKSVMKIEPGDSVGESIIVLNKKKIRKRKFSVGAGYGNKGNDFTGVRTSLVNIIADNALFLNENIVLGYVGTLEGDSSKKHSKVFNGSITIPFGYYTFGFDYSKSDFLGTQDGDGSTSKVTGFSDSNNVSIDRLILSNNKARINLQSSLTSKKSASYLNYVKTVESERKLVTVNLSSSISYYPNDSINLYLKPAYSKGIKGFNAKKDERQINQDLSRAQFEIYKIYASFTKHLKLKIPFSFTSEFNGQISKDSLFGSEQISIGGNYSVRGYRENFLIGDSGYYSRNTFNVNLSNLLPQKALNMLGDKAVYVQKMTISPFFDYGYVSNRANNNSGRLSGYGVNMVFNSDILQATVTYSKSANRSKLLTAIQKENRMIYFDVIAYLF